MVIGEVFCPYCRVWQNNLSPVGWLLDRSHGNTRGSDWLLADSSPHTKCWMLSLLGTKSLGNMTVELNCLGILDISQLAIIQHGPSWWQTSQQGHKLAWKEVDKAQNMVSFVWFDDDNDELTIQMRCWEVEKCLNSSRKNKNATAFILKHLHWSSNIQRTQTYGALVQLSSPRAKGAGPKGLRAESARAVTGRRGPHSGEGEDFVMGQRFFFYKNGHNSGTESQKIVPKVGN